jgi:hypothetical protein
MNNCFGLICAFLALNLVAADSNGDFNMGIGTAPDNTPGAKTDMGISTKTGTNTGTNTDTNTGTNADAKTDANTDMNTDINTDIDTDMNTGAAFNGGETNQGTFNDRSKTTKNANKKTTTKSSNDEQQTGCPCQDKVNKALVQSLKSCTDAINAVVNCATPANPAPVTSSKKTSTSCDCQKKVTKALSQSLKSCTDALANAVGGGGGCGAKAPAEDLTIKKTKLGKTKAKLDKSNMGTNTAGEGPVDGMDY